jgi:hypothetical protein
LKQLLEFLSNEDEFLLKDTSLQTIHAVPVSRKIKALMENEGFRDYYMKRVKLTPSPLLQEVFHYHRYDHDCDDKTAILGNVPVGVPLVPPYFCSRGYNSMIARIIKGMEKQRMDIMNTVLDEHRHTRLIRTGMRTVEKQKYAAHSRHVRYVENIPFEVLLDIPECRDPPYKRHFFSQKLLKDML